MIVSYIKNDIEFEFCCIDYGNLTGWGMITAISYINRHSIDSIEISFVNGKIYQESNSMNYLAPYFLEAIDYFNRYLKNLVFE